MDTSVNSLLDAIRKELSGEPDEVPDGFKDVAGWAKEWNLSRSQAGAYLRAGVSQGRMEAKKFRLMTPRGLYPTNLYRSK